MYIYISAGGGVLPHGSRPLAYQLAGVGLLQLFTTAVLSCSLFVRKLVTCVGFNL